MFVVVAMVVVGVLEGKGPESETKKEGGRTQVSLSFG